MSVYKRIVRGRRARNYSIDYRDEHGSKCTVSSGTSDKRRAEMIKRKLVDNARAIREGLVDPAQQRLRAEADKPLRVHAEDYLTACEGRGDAPGGLKEKRRLLNWFLDAVGGASLTSIQADAFDLRLSALTAAGKSARTVNIKIECARAFLNWCVRNNRLASNPLRILQRRNETTDSRHPRRALTVAETGCLIDVAREQAAIVSGARMRPLWYLLPLLAGLRKSDMKRLRWFDLNLEAKTPTATFKGGKARERIDVVPLHPELVRELRAVRPSHILPGALVFPRPVCNSTRQADFRRAGIVTETENGFADLHALRHTFGTRLAEADVSPVKLQRLMRHSTIDLTMRYYVHIETDSLADGLNRLADVQFSETGISVGVG